MAKEEAIGVAGSGRSRDCVRCLLGTGMNPAEVHSGRVRFCPICDGNEALDRRIGVYGSSDEAAKKALFLRKL